METIQGFELFKNENFIILIGLVLFVPFWVMLLQLGKNRKK